MKKEMNVKGVGTKFCEEKCPFGYRIVENIGGQWQKIEKVKYMNLCREMSYFILNDMLL